MLALARRWWLFALRGALLVLFGIAALVWPGITLTVLVLYLGALLLINGVFALVAAIFGTDLGGRGWLALEGALGIIAGVGTWLWPGITQLALLWLIAAWAIATGIAEIAAAIHLRRVIRGEWLLGVAGALSVLFGLLLVFRPLVGLVTLALLLGGYAILFGVLLLALGFRLRGLRERLEHGAAGSARFG
jgi:uncharacterized membrane protein HdeD (DUF308 family)